MIKLILGLMVIIASLMVITTASADGRENPNNNYPTIYGQSIVAENHYSILNQHGTPGNYDISYDGNTCFRWLSDSQPVVVADPDIITYTTPVDDFDLVHIIACECSYGHKENLWDKYPETNQAY